MASRSQNIRVGIQVFLALVIVGLVYWLYVSITEPWQVIEQRQEVTRQTRERMNHVRQALIRYDQRHDRFPHTLDTLQAWVRTDSMMLAVSDSLFGPRFRPDSLIYSPRTGRRFEYAVNDTARVRVYRLDDPDSNDFIGTLEADPTRLNAASWE
jgi:type II secretory pathway pseudopilin PulG